MPSTNPTMEDFNALDARVTMLEADVPIPPDPPDPPDPPVETNPRGKVLQWLRSITGIGWVSAQMCHSNLSEHNFNKTKGVNAALIMIDPCMDMQPEANWSNSGIDALLSHARSGGLVGVSLFIPNPITHGGSTDKSGINAAEMITPGTGQYNAYLAQCDRLIATIKPLDDAGVPVFHRILWEADGNWFWWGSGMFNPQQYQALFNIWATRMRSRLKYVIMCFATNAGNVDRYPAAARPEMVGFDGYTDHPENYIQHYHDLMAAAPDALYNFAEFGSGNASAGNPNFDTQHFVDVMKRDLPKLCMAMAWSGTGSNGWAWGCYRNPTALKCEECYQWGELPAQQQAPATASLQSVEARQRHGDGLEIAMGFADRLEAREWLVWLADRIRVRGELDDPGVDPLGGKMDLTSAKPDYRTITRG